MEGLARDVASEEASGFNPSGISNILDDQNGGPGDGTSTTETTNSHLASQTRDTDTTSSDAASSTVDSTYSMPRLTSFNQDSEESKLGQLQSIFTELKGYDVQYALKKANGDFQTALDNLLNVQYLQSTGQQAKGIDGFFQPDDEIGKKSRGKRKGKKSSSSNLNNVDSMRATETPEDSEREMKRTF